MKNQLIALVISVLLTASLRAQSTTALAVGGGASIPVGSLGHTQKAGFAAEVGVIRGYEDMPLGIRLDAAYDRLPGKTVGTTPQPKNSVVSGTLNVLLSLSGTQFKPYLLGGAGVYRLKSDAAGFTATNRFGFDFGAGAAFPLLGGNGFVETRVHSISQKKAKPVRYVPVMLGILF